MMQIKLSKRVMLCVSLMSVTLNQAKQMKAHATQAAAAVSYAKHLYML